MALKISPGLHESTVTHVAGGKDDSIVAALADAIRFAREQATSVARIDELALADKSMTREAGLLQVADAARRSAAAVAARLDDSRSKAQAEIAAISSRISSPSAPKDFPAVALESDIRRRLTELPDSERDAVIADAFAAKNQAVLSAILRGPGFLTGLKPARHEMLRSRYAKEFHQAEAERIERLQKALEATDRAGNLFVAFAKEAADSPAVRLAAENKKLREEAVAAHQGA